MDIIKADFDWISLLVVAGAGIIGLIKSATKKAPVKSAGIPREYIPEMENNETVEWFNNLDIKEKNQEGERLGDIIPGGDYYRQPEESPQEENPSFSEHTIETGEAGQEEAHHFNIRQAVISSEILRRPEY